MGKGDRKTKRGKIWRGSYGAKRIKKTTTSASSTSEKSKK